ncbi:MAG: ATP-binding cassette domain-containing protein [Eubacteriales bacterium]|nr:ATP-binding cassette domain-containing protein [Eubacteriales bacterium]
MLELKNINYIVDDKQILKDVSLKIDDKFVVITGPNGSGKSTLTKICAGIIKPTTGQVFLDNIDITNKNITERSKMGISFGFQQPVTFKGLKVSDLLKLAKGKEASFSEICDILSEVGLCARDYYDRNLDNKLSGGELKRIEIAMVIARNSKISIFDEPEAGIDLWSFQRLIQVFEKMIANTKGSILIISHQERILNIASKIIYLNDGVVERYEEKEKILPDIIKNINATCKKL